MPEQKYKQRKDGRYRTTFKGEYVYAKSSKKLEEKIAELNYLSKTGLSINDNKITFQKYADNYIDLQKRLNPQQSFSREEGLLKNHIYPEIGIIQIKKLRLTNVKNMKAKMIEKGLTEQVNRALTLVNNILNTAVDDNILFKNVATNIGSYKFKKSERKILTPDEDALLLEAANQNKHGLFFLLIRYCGLRPEEVRALEIDDIDIEKCIIDVSDAISFSKSEQGNRKDTKNLVHREVPILAFLIPHLVLAIETSKKLGTNLLFYKQTNPLQHMSKSAYKSCVNSFMYCVNQLNKKHIEEYNKQVENEEEQKEVNEIIFVPYQLRHSFCTMLYYAGVSLKEAQSIMGHRSSKMVLDVYTHLKKEEDDSKDKLDTYFNFSNLNMNSSSELYQIDVRMWLKQEQKTLVRNFLIKHKIKYGNVK